MTNENKATRVISTDAAPAPRGAYSQALVVNGFVLTAGLGPHDPQTGAIAGDSISEQTHQVLRNLSAVLAEAGATLQNVIKVTAHLADLNRDFDAYDAVCRNVFSPPYPVRTTVGSALAGMLVEIDVVARTPSGQ
jgi:2-iminobutanoate/2-iminopropanoate deaminase